MTQTTNNPPEGFPKTHPVYGDYYKTDLDTGIVIYKKGNQIHGIDINDKSYQFLKQNDIFYFYNEGDGVLHSIDGKTKLPPPTNFNFDPNSFKSEEAIQFENFIKDPNNKDVIDKSYDRYQKEFGSKKALTKEQYIKSLIDGNNYNYAAKNAYVSDLTLDHPNWDLNLKDGKVSGVGDKNVFAKEYADYIGFSNFNDDFINDFQGSYITLAKTSVDPAYSDKFKNYGLSLVPEGVTDQMAITGLNSGVSTRDAVWGNTTNEQKVTYTPPIKTSTTPPVVTDPNVNVTENTGTKPPDNVPIDDTQFPKDIKRPIDTWFAPDITNFVGALTDKVNRYEPSQSKVNLVDPDYVLLDPTRQLAANQEQMARYSDMIANSVDPQIALATMLASSGEGFQNAANVLANVENANVQITNQALNNQAQYENQEIAANEQGRQQYIAQMATLNENYDKAQNLKKWRTIGAWNNGWHNFTKDQMMEQVLFPQVHGDNITGAVSVIPGRDFTQPDTYNSPMYSDRTTAIDPQNVYDSYIKSGYDPATAMRFTELYMNQKSSKKRSTEQDYADSQGLTVEEFGGIYNINNILKR